MSTDVPKNAMNEMHFGNKVRQILNEGLQLDAAQAEKLATARQRALARQRPEPALALQWADNALVWVGGWGGLSLRVLLPLAVLVASLTTIYSWQQNQRIAELADIDAQLLTDDLPIDAYLDRGFQNWLKKRATEE